MSLAYRSGLDGVMENVPGIPLAPLGQRHFKASDYDYLERKRLMAPRLPLYTREEIARRKHAFYIVLLHEMLQAGYQDSVRELAQIFRREDQIVDKAGVTQFSKLITQQKKVYMMADILRASEEYESAELFETAAVIRRELGQKLMKENDTTLAKHFLRMALLISEKSKVKSATLDRLQAEIHCLLAFIARENSENIETALDSAVNHLAICRELSKDQSWHFAPHVLSIRIKKPIALHGLREEYEEVDACSMSLYMIATLLEHEMMLGLAHQILHSHRYPSDQDIAQAHVFADTALRLAFEVHQSVALSSALLRFGIVLRHAGEYDDAIKYFKQLSNHSEVGGDNETFAIAQHNIAMSHIAKHDSMKALECLTKQKEIADTSGIMDLQADALEELGLILLQEGQLWEAEECYASAYECFKSIENDGVHSYRQHCEQTFAMWGIAAGQQLWSRFAGLIRTDSYESIGGLIDWKSRRTPLPKVPRPDYTPDAVSDVYTPYHLEEAEEDEEEEESENEESPHQLEIIEAVPEPEPSVVAVEEVERREQSITTAVTPMERTQSEASNLAKASIESVAVVPAAASVAVPPTRKGYMSDMNHCLDNVQPETRRSRRTLTSQSISHYHGDKGHHLREHGVSEQQDKVHGEHKHNHTEHRESRFSMASHHSHHSHLRKDGHPQDDHDNDSLASQSIMSISSPLK